MREDLKKFLKCRTICGLIAANFLVFVMTLLTGDRFYEAGQLYARAVLEEGQWWRLVTAMFLHAGIQHIGSNMIVLYAAGVIVEHNYGHLKTFLIYMLSGIGGNLFSIWYETTYGIQRVSVGASGAVYGILAAMIVLIVLGRKQIRRGSSIWVRLFLMLVYFLYSGTVASGVNNQAHIGGFVCGAVLALLLSAGMRRVDLRDVYL